jgi:hypothetical protein
MRHLMMGLILAGGMLASTAGESRAQFSLTIGNPYYGSGIAIGNAAYPYGFGNYGGSIYPGYLGGYGAFSNSAYVAGPGAFSYSSGYRGFVPPAVGYGAPVVASPYGYVNRPYYGYRSYYGYGRPYGFRPFRGAFSWLR